MSTWPSVVRYTGVKEASDGQPLHWGRTDIDGLPFRGPSPAYPLREEEFEERLVSVSDFRHAFFEMTKKEDRDRFNEIMEKNYAGWYRVIFIQRFINNTMQHYVEWLERFVEDGQRVPSAHVLGSGG